MGEISISSDFKIYEEYFNVGIWERLYQNSNIFNANSGGGILFVTDVHQGNYLYNAYFKQIANLVTRQNIASVAAVDTLKMEQDEEISVKIHRKIGPVSLTKKAFKMAGLNSFAAILETEQGSLALGRLVGDDVLKNMASAAIIAVNAAVSGVSGLIHDITGETTKTANIKSLIRTRGKWGDQMGSVASWIMHSLPMIDLSINALDYNLESVGGLTIARGNVERTVGGPILISDNSNLKNSGSPETYNVLGLKPGACIIRQSELTEIFIKGVTRLEQLAVDIQGEYALSVGIDGFKWDVANGLANPTDAYLGTSDYWDKVRTDTTGIGIVKMKCQ